MKQHEAPCSLCGNPVNTTDRTVPRKVQGWSTTGQAGGSDIFLREYKDEWACRGCIEKMKAGVSINQESLIPDPLETNPALNHPK